MVLVKAHAAIAITQDNTARTLKVAPALTNVDGLKASIHFFLKHRHLFVREPAAEVPMNQWESIALGLAKEVVAGLESITIRTDPLTTLHRPVGDVWKWDEPGHVYEVLKSGHELREFLGEGAEAFIVHYLVCVYPT